MGVYICHLCFDPPVGSHAGGVASGFRQSVLHDAGFPTKPLCEDKANPFDIKYMNNYLKWMGE